MASSSSPSSRCTLSLSWYKLCLMYLHLYIPSSASTRSPIPLDTILIHVPLLLTYIYPISYTPPIGILDIICRGAGRVLFPWIYIHVTCARWILFLRSSFCLFRYILTHILFSWLFTHLLNINPLPTPLHAQGLCVLPPPLLTHRAHPPPSPPHKTATTEWWRWRTTMRMMMWSHWLR